MRWLSDGENSKQNITSVNRNYYSYCFGCNDVLCKLSDMDKIRKDIKMPELTAWQTWVFWFLLGFAVNGLCHALNWCYRFIMNNVTIKRKEYHI